MRNIVDFYIKDNFGLSHSNELGLDPHVIDEEVETLINNIPDSDSVACFSKEDLNGDVDLSSFKPQNELNSKIWINGLINSRVRLRLLDIADDFIDTLEVDWAEPKDIVLTGSLANFNWSNYSDFDLHIVYDFNEIDERKEFVKDYFNAKKNEWNDLHDNLKIYGFPVEIYVEDSAELHVSSALYSLEKNSWIKRPEKNKIKAIKLDKFLIKDKVRKYAKIILKLKSDIDNETDEVKLEKLAKKVKIVFDRLKKGRQEGLKKSGEMSPFNICYKALRRLGFLDILFDLKANTYDKINSIK